MSIMNQIAAAIIIALITTLTVPAMAVSGRRIRQASFPACICRPVLLIFLPFYKNHTSPDATTDERILE